MKKVNTLRWTIFSILGIGYILVYFHRLCTAVVAVDMMNDLKADGSLIGLLASAYFYPYALMQMPSGLLADSWGPRKTITLFFFIAGVSSILLGMADTPARAVIARLAVGLGVAMFFIPTLKLMTGWFRISEFSTMAGLLMGIGGIGALTAAGPFAELSSLIGWRGSFTLIGAATIVISLLIWLIVRDTPEKAGLPPIEVLLPQSGVRQDIGLAEGLKLVLISPDFWKISGWFFFNFAVYFSFMGLWGGPYLMHVYGMSKVQAGGVLSMQALAMILATPLLCRLSDKYYRSRKRVIVICSSLSLALTVPPAFFTAGMSVWLLYILIFLMGLSMQSVVAVAFSSVKELFPVKIAGTATGVVNFFPFLGGALMQPLLGHILDGYGKTAQGYSVQAYASAFKLYVASSAIALVIACFIRETFPEVSGKQ